MDDRGSPLQDIPDQPAGVIVGRLDLVRAEHRDPGEHQVHLVDRGGLRPVAGVDREAAVGVYARRCGHLTSNRRCMATSLN
jgi:hypothetical protein